MTIHDHDPYPLMNDGLQRSLGSSQPMFRFPFKTASRAKAIKVPIDSQADVLTGKPSAAGDKEHLDDSAAKGNVSLQKHRSYESFDSKLDALERTLAVREMMKTDPPNALDDIVRMQIKNLMPAVNIENRESSIAKYVERLADIREYHLCSRWAATDYDGQEEDRNKTAKWIEETMAGLIRIMDLHKNTALVRDLDPLTALESLNRIDNKLPKEYSVAKTVKALIEQQIRALLLELYSPNQAGHSCSVLMVILADV